MSSPHHPYARSLSHSPASRWTAGCGASRGITISAPDTPKQLTRRRTDKHDDTNITRGFKIRAVEEQALVPSTLVTAEWLSDSVREDTVLAVWRKGKVRDCHLTEGSHFVYIRSIYDSVTLGVWLLAAFSSFPEEMHLSSVINGDKDCRARRKLMRWDAVWHKFYFRNNYSEVGLFMLI